ncbi:MAG: hypothetical protein WC460_02530 [Patescibacteria group bacterium]
MFKGYTKRENLIVLVIIGTALLLSSLPYAVGFFWGGQNHFLGGSHMNLGDVSVYRSYIEQAKEGKILVLNLFTSETQTAMYFTPLWLVLGLLARLFSLNSLLIFHLARFLAGFLFLYFIFYYFLDLFFKKYWDKIIALLLICFSSGLGLFFKPQTKSIIFDAKYIWQNFSVDLIMPESNTFLTLAHSALFVISQLLILLTFYWLIKANTQKKTLFFLFGVSFILGLIHTYDILIVLGVSLAYLITGFIFRKQSLIFNFKNYILKIFIIGLGYAPAFYYFYFIVRREPALWGWISQNITDSPSFKMYLIAYGFLIFFSIFSLRLLKKQNNKNVYFLIVWVLTLFVLAYLPLSFQRRLISTEHIALAILATYSLSWLVAEILKIYKKRWQNILTVILLFVFMSLANLSFVVTVIYDYIKLPQIFYLPDSFYQAAVWLKTKSLSNEAVLASAQNGMILPPFINRPVFLGSGHQTLDFQHKRELLDKWFFQDNNQADAKKQFLQNYNIKYIFYTAREKLLGNYDLDKADYLQQVYANKEVKIYKLID